MGNCRDCKHFRSEDRAWPDGYPFRGWGGCRRLTDHYITDTESDGPDDGRLAIPYDYEGYSAGIYVSPAFGCVQFEGRVSSDDE